jgi:hypothetical protein
MKKKAFTVSEMAIALVILGIVILACYSIFKTTTIHTNDPIIKRAFYMTETVVRELLSNDDTYYNEGETLCSSTDNNINYHGFDYSGTDKFIKLFQSKLNLDTHYNNTLDNFKTIDGIQWTHRDCCTSYPSDYCSADWSPGHVFEINVNPAQKSPCEAKYLTGTTTPICRNPNKFNIEIKANGHMRISPEHKYAIKAIQYIPFGAY